MPYFKSFFLGALTCLLHILSTPASAEETKEPDYYTNASGIGGFMLSPLETKTGEVDPLVGIHYALFVPNVRMMADLGYRNISEDSVSGYEIFYGLSMDLLYHTHPLNKLGGAYAGIGGGHYWDRAKVEVDFFGDQESSSKTWALEGVVGYFFPKAELWAAYIIYPSNNVSSALRIGFTYFTSGD